jgi:hypothetical protein
MVFALSATSLSLHAAAKPVKPDICESVANYAAQALMLEFADGTWADPVNPSRVTIKRDFKKFPITKSTDLGSCEDDQNKFPEPWCQVAGGSPEVLQYEISAPDSLGTNYPVAKVTVTYNRGGCHVDQAERL